MGWPPLAWSKPFWSPEPILNKLKNELDKKPLPETPGESSPRVSHDNIRGPKYYDNPHEEH